MALNISRGKYQSLYSSDRISSLIGNGLLVFIDINTEFNKLFTDKEVIFYKNKQDLINKIKYYSSNSKLRRKKAELGYKKYHKFMNNRIVANYILQSVNLIEFKKPYWHNLI
jgi:spore maturation protein CgeB